MNKPWQLAGKLGPGLARKHVFNPRSLKTPDGKWSPAAFSPKPSLLSQNTSNAQLLPAPARGMHAELALEIPVQPGAPPTEGHLAHDEKEQPFLALFSPQASMLVAVSLRGVSQTAQADAKAEVQFAKEGIVSVAAVQAMRHYSDPGKTPVKDLLLLHANGRLGLHIGSRLVCFVTLVSPTAGSASPYAALLGQVPADAGAQAVSPAALARSATSGSDVSMQSVDNDDDSAAAARSPRSNIGSGPDVQALGAALEHPPEPIKLQDAVGDRVDVVLRDGQRMRVQLPFAPASPLPKLALEALAVVLPPASWFLLFSCQLAAPGGACGRVDLEWGAFAGTLRKWAANPGQLSPQRLPRFTSGSQTTTVVTPAPTPGGSVDSTAAAAAFQALLQSPLHRRVMSSKQYTCFRASHTLSSRSASPADSALQYSDSAAHRRDVQAAFDALHSIYEEFKLDTRRWRLLQLLGELLVDLAALLGLPHYVDFYQRDLGPSLHPTITQPLPGAGVPQGASLRVPSMHSTLLACIQGKAAAAQKLIPLLVAKQASCMSRAICLLDLLTCFASSTQTLLRLLSAEGAEAKDQMWEQLKTAAEQLVQVMVQKGVTLTMLETIPPGVSLPLREALQRCRADPPTGWTPEAYVLIGREDIAATMAARALATAPDAITQLPGALDQPGSTAGGTSIGSAWPAAGVMSSTPALPAGRPPLPSPVRQPALRTPALGGTQHPRSRLSHAPSDIPYSSPLPATPAAPKVSFANEPLAATGRQAMAESRGAETCVPHHMLSLPHSLQISMPGLAADREADGGQAKAQATTGKGPLAAKDGLEGLDQGPARLRFSHDSRLAEVRRLLGTALPGPIRLAHPPEGGDPELVTAQQARLMAVAVRTMGLPIGRGALGLGTLKPLPTEALTVPPLSLAGCLPEQHNAIVNLDLTAATPAPGGGAAADFTAWPEFHNGVAAGLRLAPGAVRLTRAWIVYNKPLSPTYTHAGLLMGLGLSGQLACLSATDIYRYLSQEHEATTIGVLLGMAAAHRATMDATTSKMLFLHVPSRHPATYPELELSPLVQAAALLGIGLVYQGSCHRVTAEVMMDEIGRRPGGSPQETAASGRGARNSRAEGTAVGFNREGYALAAGLALGLITLGRGSSLPSLHDLDLPNRLRYYMIGGTDPSMMGTRYAPGEAPGGVRWPGGAMGPPLDTALMDSSGTAFSASRSSGADMSVTAYQGASQVTLEGNLVNLDVTSPASTLALGLMYLRTNDEGIAESFSVPTKRFGLDFVRPDFIMLRVLAKNLVMWDDMQPTAEWLSSQLPDIIKGPISRWNDRTEDSESEDSFEAPPDSEASAQAHINALAGACLALGIKFAGSADTRASDLLHSYVLYFLSSKQAAPDPVSGAAAVWGLLDKQALENCMGVIIMALAAVMAGTGDLRTFKLLRALRKRLSPSGPIPNSGAVFHGNHMMVAMGLGLLFLGAGRRTLATHNAGVAALVIALYPRFPVAPTDNRCHLQAFRHLYMLATEPRSMQAVDVHSGKAVHVPMKPTTHANDRRTADGIKQAPRHAQSEALRRQTAPCLLPQSQQARDSQVLGPRYYEHTIRTADEQPTHTDAAAQSHATAGSSVYVQRKQGALNYAADPSGMRGLLNRSLKVSRQQHQRQKLGSVEPREGACSHPFMQGFARAFCQSTAPPPDWEHAPAGVEAAGDTSPLEQQREQAFKAWCHAGLHECTVQDKPFALSSMLQLHCLVQSLVRLGQSPHGLAGSRGLTGGLPPTLQLQDLRLALGYADSAAALALARLAATGSPEAGWDPVLSPGFLKGLAAQLEALWRRLGFAGDQACAPNGAMRQYLQSAQLPKQLAPTGAGAVDSAQLAELFASACAWLGLPAPQAATQAASTVPHTLQSLPQAAATSGVAKALLASALPEASPAALQLIAACLQQQ